MAMFLIGVVAMVLASAFGWHITQLESRLERPYAELPARGWFRSFGLTVSALMYFGACFVTLGALAPQLRLIPAGDAPLALATGLFLAGFGTVLWLAIQSWPLRADEHGLQLPFIKAPWSALLDVHETEWVVYVDCHPSHWNCWSGRLAFPRLLWAASGSGEFWDGVRAKAGNGSAPSS